MEGEGVHRRVIQPDFGIRIRSLRRDHGLSQRKLAELISRSEDLIGKLERDEGFVGEDTLARLATVFDISPDSLFDFNGNKAFIESGGLKWRAPREKPTLIVRHKKVILRVPRKGK